MARPGQEKRGRPSGSIPGMLRGLASLAAALSDRRRPEPAALLEKALALAVRELRALPALGFTVVEGTGDLVLRVHRRLPRGVVARPGPWGCGLMTRVAARGRSAVSRAGRRDRRLSAAERALFPAALMAAPFHSGGQVAGVLAVGGGTFTRIHAGFLKALAGQVSLGLERSRLLVSLDKQTFDAVQALSVAIEAKDAYTEGHVQRVTQYAVALGEELGLPDEEIRSLQFGATLHDIGKIGIRSEVLNKEGPLTPEELTHVREHPLIGERIVGEVDFLQAVRPLVRHHQERFDGSGYPGGLQGEEIPFLARIIAVADAYDAMAIDRPYRRARGHAEALAVLRREAGRQFDPTVVKAFLRIFGD